MQKIIFGTIFTILLNVVSIMQAQAQRFAYVDTEFILKQSPEYSAAQKQIETLSQQWAKEIEEKRTELDRMQRALVAEKVLLNKDMYDQRQKDIAKKESELNALQQKHFGYEGDLFKKRQELIKPIQDKVYNAIKDMANSRSYDFVLDKSSGGAGILFANAKFDRSEDIIELLGYVKKTNTTKPNTTDGNSKEPNRKTENK
jgi:outer membrane protein